jgi:hypothetical protein
MKLLEEKGLREKIINQCILMENELQEYVKWNLAEEKTTNSIYEKKRHLDMVDNAKYAIEEISELRMKLIRLLDNEKVE